MSELALWYNDCDYVIAEDTARATVEYLKFIGGDTCDDFEWRRIPDEKPIALWIEEDGKVGEPNAAENNLVRRPAHEWVGQLGRGYVGSTEW